MKYLKVKGEVIAFDDADVFDIARYAIAFPRNVYPRVGGGYTVFNHRHAKITDIVKRGVGEYMIGWYPTANAGSLYRVCSLLCEGRS